MVIIIFLNPLIDFICEKPMSYIIILCLVDLVFIQIVDDNQKEYKVIEF